MIAETRKPGIDARNDIKPPAVGPTVMQRQAHDWPEFNCPSCGEEFWYDGFGKPRMDREKPESMDVVHCAICELVVTRYD